MTVTCRARRALLAAAVAVALVAAIAACASPAMPIEGFVAAPHLRGVPYADARVYGERDLSFLIAHLGDAGRAPQWSVAATTLAMIGTPAAVECVVTFIASSPPENVRPDFERARRNAVLSLGYAANGGRSEPALRYLIESLETHVWQRRGVTDSAATARQLTEQALLGLALAATPESAAALRAYAADASRPADLRAVARSALTELARVARFGLEAYDRARFAP